MITNQHRIPLKIITPHASLKDSHARGERQTMKKAKKFTYPN